MFPSHDRGRTFQTITDILSNGGGTQNGQISFDLFEDGLGYHIYWQVLNTKDYGIPQNRERIFIVGFKDFREFSFPKKMKLHIKLGDILQDNPNSKYFLTDKGIENLNKNQEFNKFNPLNKESELAACITARANKVSNDNNFIMVQDKYMLSKKAIEKIERHNNKTIDNDISNCIHAGYYKQGGRDQQYIRVDEKYYLSDKMIQSFTKHKERHTEKGTGFKWEVKKKDDIANCLRANASLCPTDNTIITHSLHPRSSKTGKGGTGHLSKTDGTAYCLDTSNAQAIELNEKIRRLTPLECWRLQGFKDNEFFSVKDVSDTQLYKQAGNSITVNVLVEIFKKIL